MTAIERQIIDRLLTDAIAAGCLVSGHDGEGWFISKSADKGVIMKDLGATGMDSLVFRRGGERVGSVSLIYSGDYDVISDCTASEEMGAIMAGATALAEKLAA